MILILSVKFPEFYRGMLAIRGSITGNRIQPENAIQSLE